MIMQFLSRHVLKKYVYKVSILFVHRCTFSTEQYVEQENKTEALYVCILLHFVRKTKISTTILFSLKNNITITGQILMVLFELYVFVDISFYSDLYFNRTFCLIYLVSHVICMHDMLLTTRTRLTGWNISTIYYSCCLVC